jgi:tRNA (mo5U34)-methyltransferase
MQDREIREKIASFPRWHYEFDLQGNLTPIHKADRINRHRQRKKYFFDPLVHLLGGTFAGKRVLDLGCNAGFWSLCAAEAGCDYVLGIDGRQMHIDQANFVFEANGIGKERYDFVTSDLFNTDLQQFGTFDIVLCLGVMYHISKHMELMENISEMNGDILLIDSGLARLPGSGLRIKHEDLEDPRNAVDRELVMVPTWEGIHDLVHQFGYSAVTLKPRFEDYEGATEYETGARRAFLCAKQTDVTQVPAEVEQAPPPTPIQQKTQRLRQRSRRLEQQLKDRTQQLKNIQASRSWKLLTMIGVIKAKGSKLLRRS